MSIPLKSATPSSSEKNRAKSRGLILRNALFVCSVALLGTWMYYRWSPKNNVILDRGRAAIPVEVVVAATADIAHRTTINGVLKPQKEVALTTSQGGRIASISFAQGDQVKKGQVLLTLDQRLLRSQIARAKPILDHAVTRLTRIQKLVEKGWESTSNLEKAISEKNQAQAELERAEAELALSEIVAPFSGVIGLLYVSEGAFVSPNQEIAKLVNQEQLYVDFSLPESYTEILKKSPTILFYTEGDSAPYMAKILASDARVDWATHTLPVRALFDNRKANMTAGKFVRVLVTLEEQKGAVVIPRDAIIKRDDTAYIMVVHENRVQQREVMLGIHDQTNVSILEGLKSGESVIIAGQSSVRDGYPVRIVSSRATQI